MCNVTRYDFFLHRQSADEFEGAHEIILEEREELSSEAALPDGSESSVDTQKSKVIDNATNMTEVDMSFEIEEIEVRIAQVCPIVTVLPFGSRKNMINL